MTREGWERGPYIDWTEDPATGCWNWGGAIQKKGYGTVVLSGRTYYAHRLIYEWEVGPIPEGLTIDHLCRNRACVNPDHLEPVTNRENQLRGESPTARHARKTHCIHGHEFTPENTYERPGVGRACRVCKRRTKRASRARKKADPNGRWTTLAVRGHGLSEIRQRRPVVPRRRKLSRVERDYERECQENFKLNVIRLDKGCIGASAFGSEHSCTGPLEAHHCVKQQWLRTHVSAMGWDENRISEFLWDPAVGATLCSELHRQHSQRIHDPVPLEWLPARVMDFCRDWDLMSLLCREHPPAFSEGEGV